MKDRHQNPVDDSDLVVVFLDFKVQALFLSHFDFFCFYHFNHNVSYARLAPNIFIEPTI